MIYIYHLPIYYLYEIWRNCMKYEEKWRKMEKYGEKLEKEMATHSSILAWRIPWKEEPGRLQSTGSQRVRHDWATSLHFIWNVYYFVYILYEIIGKWIALPQSLIWSTYHKLQPVWKFDSSTYWQNHGTLLIMRCLVFSLENSTLSAIQLPLHPCWYIHGWILDSTWYNDIVYQHSTLWSYFIV